MFIIACLSTAQLVVDSVHWCVDTSGDYYEEQAGEEISEDLQLTKEAQEWRADDVK